jgi:hypothetical protein
MGGARGCLLVLSLASSVFLCVPYFPPSVKTIELISKFCLGSVKSGNPTTNLFVLSF